jgi:DNA-binding response OmpR family regulator
MGKRILLVEDDELLREMYALKLNLEGFEVETAADGREGLQKATSSAYDVILLDNLMPYMSGLELLQKLNIAKSAHATKVIMLSNKSSLPEINLAKRLGASDYLIKSQHTPKHVVDMIRNVLTQGQKV